MLLHFLVFLLLCQSSAISGHCPSVNICECQMNVSQIICDGHFSNQTANAGFDFPSLSSLPLVDTYVFRNFKDIRSHAFENVSFLPNRSINIHLVNVETIRENAFSEKIRLSNDSTLSIHIEQNHIFLQKHAFHHVQIDRLRFVGLQNFNNQSLFDSRCFGDDLRINELVFEESGLSGFIDASSKSIKVGALLIRHSPFSPHLNSMTFPSYLGTVRSLELMNTSLQSIDAHSFQAWILVLEEFLLKKNSNLTSISNNMVDGVLMLLETLDLSENGITTIDPNYNWFPFSYARNLRLKNQQLDLFLKTNILKTLSRLRKIDFSNGFIVNDNHTNDNLIPDYVPDLPNLSEIDISHANLTEDMVIDLLRGLSRSANETIQVRLLGHRLSNNSFCSYFNIFRRAPNLLRLDLDEDHECNCVVDLFYRDEGIQTSNSYSDIVPSCLFDTNRVPCDIQKAVKEFRCPLGGMNPDEGGSNTGLLGNYAFIGLMVGIGVLLVILVGVGSGLLYRGRMKRRLTDADMEVPVERSDSSTVEQAAGQQA